MSQDHTLMDQPLVVSDKIVILELKFSGRFPNWYRELVRVFHFFQTGAAKYMEGPPCTWAATCPPLM